MASIPVYPQFDVKVMNDDQDSWITNTVAVRVETRVPAEFIQEFLRRLGVSLGELTASKKEIVSGTS